MNILGIANNDYSGACLIIDGEIISAASEERFTRIKAHNSFPNNAIAFVLKEANISLDIVDKIAYSWASDFSKDKHLELYFERIVETCLSSPKDIPILRKRLKDEIINDAEKQKEFNQFLVDNNVTEKAIYIDHHESHANAAFLCSPFDDGITVSCDGRGDFQSFTLSKFLNNTFTVLQRETTFDSLGYFYGRITALLGFKPNRHEGKITGLAAHGNPTKLLKKMKKLIDVDKNFRIRAKFHDGYLPSYENNYEKLKELFLNDKPEDIAAAAQRHIENILITIIQQYISKENPQNLCLAGGVFGNVKLNQRLRELDGVKNIYVLPAMGDDGLPLCSAICCLFKFTGKRIKIPSMKIGPKMSESEDILKLISGKYNYKIMNKNDVIYKSIKALKLNKVIGLAKGRMEFGPRALCNRSIICRAKDATINTWLNERMNRTEFMPFAPIVADIFAKDCFYGWDNDHIASHFMTMTYDCTDYFKNYCPAVTHIDGTARPQIVTNQSDPFTYKLLIEWNKESNEPALINTSFNIHEEPIICTAENALNNLDKGVVDLLIFNENLIVWKDDFDMGFLYE
ncbi:carbamoyltransferase C-terminal domain-containing protein [Photobacterium leiognathi]|uniref:carbamoyltransferase C-terminal domain-containing protein n=1 Tax=Photobacterium leiognathi TaxID=553611 RepID=UPI002982A4B5|nr:carbamoyltransferase C-terminal domain-containing protein [Photobacterium leiognathi]